MHRSLLRALVVLVPLAAALETARARWAAPWRGYGAELFAQSLVLWSALGLLALLPAALTLRVLHRRSRRGAPAPGPAFVCALGWLTLPLAVHATLDHHTRFGGVGLAEARPWLEAAGVLLVGSLALGWLATRTRRAPPRGVTAAIFVVVLVVAFWPVPAERAAPAMPASNRGAGATRPNLLLVVWDTCRSDKLDPYGHEPATTPNVARFAEQAIVFENAVAPATFTFTSHLSILTGVHPSTHGARFVRSVYDPERARSIAEALAADGYRTAAFVGTEVLTGRTGIRSGFEVYDDRVDPAVCDTLAWRAVHDAQSVLARIHPVFFDEGTPHGFQDFQRPAEEVLERALAWIERDDERPWFCLINLYDVHWPYEPRGAGRALVGEYDGPLGGRLFRGDAWVPGTEITERDRRHVAELYQGEIHELDQATGAFLDALDLGRGGTAVVLTADHGEAFGEGGRWSHGDIGEVQVRVPLIVRPPDPAPRGRRVAARVSGIDVAPTLLGLAGVSPLPPGIEGRDLLAAELPHDRPILVEDRDHLDPRDVRVALYRGPWKIVRHGLGDAARFELFDLRTEEERDVSEEHPRIFAELAALLGERRRAADAAESGAGGMPRPRPRIRTDALSALGYVGP